MWAGVCFGTRGFWWVVAIAALAFMVRRWWVVGASAALVAGVLVGAVHAEAIPEYEQGHSYDVTVRLTQAARISHGQWGDSWYATAQVVAGAPSAAVTVRGSQQDVPAMGDLLSARVRATAPTRPGQAASLWIQGSPQIQRAAGIAPALRARMRSVAHNTDPGWLLSGMTLGLDQGLSEQAASAMQACGLTHLTAVSGANCAVLLVIVWWIGGWLALPRPPRVALSAVVLAAFVVIVGSEPSVVRAAAMATLALIGALVGGRKAAAHVLQIAVIALLLIDPWLAYSVGFMLSIAATAGLIALLERGPLAATVAAQVATMPILLAIGASVGPQSVLANVVVTPFAAVIPVLGLISLVLPPVAGLGRLLCEIVLWVAGWDLFAPLPWLGGWMGVGLAAVLALVVFTLGRSHLVVVAVALFGIVSLTVRWADAWPPKDWWLVACDVGQGDGFVVRDGAATIVVDTGPDPQLMDACLDRLHITSISLLVLTHFHADHVGGLAGVVHGRQVSQVWVSPCHDPPETFQDVLPQLQGLPTSVPTPGTQAQVGGLHVSVLWPQRLINAGSVPNNASVSFYLTSARGTVAFFGDVEQEAQQAILASGEPLRADVVKVPHHGSADFDADLPTAVRPRIALIGVGENSFGHPTPEAVMAWSAVGAQVFATQGNGDIALTADGVATRGVSPGPGR